MAHLTLPLPPSVNDIWKPHGRVFHLSPAYRRWKTDAGWLLKSQRPVCVPGRYNLTVYLPEDMPGDIDNRIKAISDLLVSHGVVDDDRFAWSLTVYRAPHIATGHVSIFVSKHTNTATRVTGGDVAQSPAAAHPGGGMEAA